MSANERIAVGAQRDDATNGLTMVDHEALERALTYCRTERAGRSQELDAKLAGDGFRYNARANSTRWFCPPERELPISPIRLL